MPGWMLRSFGFMSLTTVSHHFVLPLKANVLMINKATHMTHEHNSGVAKLIIQCTDRVQSDTDLLYIREVCKTRQGDCNNTEADD